MYFYPGTSVAWKKKLKFIMNFFIQILFECSALCQFNMTRIQARLKKYCNEVCQFTFGNTLSFAVTA